MQEILNPFPGIRSFEPFEAPIFFGREKHIEELKEILLIQKFVAILGASGTGKSSLVKAGIIPHLQNVSNNIEWGVFYFNPGQSPLENLSKALESLFVELKEADVPLAEEVLAAQMKRSDDVLFNVFQAHHKIYRKNYFLYIDQFEEIFRFIDQESIEAQAWIKNLIYLQEQNLPCYLTLSLRSDYLGHAIAFEGLPELINRGNYLVPQLEKKDLEKVITGPLERFGIEISPDLIKLLLADIDNSPEHLLILQHVLMRTYKEWKRNGLMDNPISKHHYQAVGTIQKALSMHGEQIYGDLNSDDKQIAERLFKALLLVGTPEGDTKVPVQISQMALITGQPVEKVMELVDRFRSYDNAFLHPSTSIKLSPKTIVDLAHESVLLKWERGTKWVEEESNAAELYIRLSKASELYQIGKGGLWINPELSLALNWQKTNTPTKAWAERYNKNFERAINFLEHSQYEHLEELRRTDEAQKRKITLFRTFAIVLGTAALVSIFLTIMALNLRFKAESSEKVALENERQAIVARKEAEEKSKEAISNKKVAQQQQLIAEEQQRLAEKQRLFAVKQQKIALEQKRIAEEKTVQATQARNEALVQKNVAENAQKVAETQRNKADSLRGIAEDQTKISERLRNLAIARSIAVQSSKLHRALSEQELPKLLAKEAFLMNQSSKGPFLEPDIYTALSNFGNADNVLIGHSDQVRAVTVISETELLTAADDGKLLHWDLSKKKNELLVELKMPIQDLSYDPVNKMIYLLANKKEILLLDKTSKKKYAPIFKSQTIIKKIEYSKKGLLFFNNNELLVIKPSFQGQAHKILSFKYPIIQFKTSPDYSKLACALANGDLVVIDFTDNIKEIKRISNSTPINAMAFDTKNELLAFGDEKYELKVWDLKFNHISASNIKHRTQINTIVFNPNYPILASCSYDQTIRFWDYQSGVKDEPVVIPDHESWVHEISFLPSGKALISAAKDRTIRKWYILPELLYNKINTSRNLTKEEKEKYIGQDINIIGFR